MLPITELYFQKVMIRSIYKWQLSQRLSRERKVLVAAYKGVICNYSHRNYTSESSTERTYKQLSNDVRDIFSHAVDSVLPGTMVRNNLKVNTFSHMFCFICSYSTRSFVALK